MRRIFLIFGFILIFIFALLTIRFIIGGSEDTWLCRDGEWVKHGVPAKPAPTTGCGDDNQSISSFDECVAAGNDIMKSNPRQCRAKDGALFVEEIGHVNDF